MRAHPPQGALQEGHGGRVVEGGAGGGPGQHGGPLVRARGPQAVQQAGYALGLSRGAQAAARLASAAAWSCAPASRRLSSRRATPMGC